MVPAQKKARKHAQPGGDRQHPVWILSDVSVRLLDGLNRFFFGAVHGFAHGLNLILSGQCCLRLRNPISG
jgi:hypothetical protein